MKKTISASIPPKAGHTGGLSGTALKYIACLSMLLDHIGASCLEGGVLSDLKELPYLSDFFAGRVPDMVARLSPALRGFCYLDIGLRAIGRLAFPIYCFLLVEGFLHTRSAKKYLFRLGIFALISEVPFDAAFFSSPVFPQHQNVYFTLFFGLLAIMGIRYFSEKPGLLAKCGQIAIPLCCCAGAFFLYTDYDLLGVALIVFLYLLRQKRVRQLIVGGATLYWEFPAPLAFVLLFFYNGKRGSCPRWAQITFYCFYPAHLAILAVITNCLLR